MSAAPATSAEAAAGSAGGAGSPAGGRYDGSPGTGHTFLVGLLLTLLAGGVAAVLLAPPELSAGHVATSLLLVGVPLFAAHASWQAHRRRAGLHAGWGWIAAGCLAAAVGAAVSLLGDLAGGAALGELADVPRVLQAVLIAIALVRFPLASESPLSRWRMGLDRIVIGGSLLLASLVWAVDPVGIEGPGSLAPSVPALRLLADVTVVSVVLSRCMGVPHERLRAWAPLATGIWLVGVADTFSVAPEMGERLVPGGFIDAMALAGFALVLLAACAPAPTGAVVPGSEARPQTVLQQLVPYAAIALAIVGLVGDPVGAHHHDRYLWLGIPLAVAVAVRQVVAVADHAALARNLAAAVDRRTAQLRHREQFWRDLVQNLSDVVVVIGTDGGIRYCSPSADAVLGQWPMEVANATELQRHVHPDDVEEVLSQMTPVLSGRQRNGFAECRVERADGGWGWFEVTALGQLAERALEGAVLTLHDVTERRRLTDRLTHEAYHDALTGLPNRSLLMRRIKDALDRPGDQPIALLLIDLDDFKVINDRHGHASGDLVLEVIGRRLRAVVRESDTVARLGGDEFALLTRGSGEEVRALAARLIDEIGRPVIAGGRRFLVRGSVGVVFAEDTASNGEETPHSLLSHADIALYEAKARDKGGMVLIDGDERDAAAKQVHLREQIAQPVLEQFSVVYQPIVDLHSGLVRGVECLLRWHHPDLGDVPPDEFIPMAEHGGSIQKLGWHVLTEACDQLLRWKEEAPEHRLAIGVNVSSRQLDEPGFAGRVLRLLQDRGIEPELIVLELTEQSLAVDFETAVAVVAELRAGGVSVAVDDYGTGYSSLRYLHRFDADVVKIDRSFIAKLEGSVHTQKIVHSVLDMSVALDLQSIAEGIETREQLALVRELGCELGQGYLFSRPVPAAQISELLGSEEQQAAIVEHVGSPTR